MSCIPPDLPDVMRRAPSLGRASTLRQDRKFCGGFNRFASRTRHVPERNTRRVTTVTRRVCKTSRELLRAGRFCRVDRVEEELERAVRLRSEQDFGTEQVQVT